MREESAAHLYGRVRAHQIAGLSEGDATEKALSEPGSPGLVNAGLARLYTLPTVTGSSLAVAALCLSALAFWPKGLAQPAVEASLYWPTEACVKAQQMDTLYGARQEFDTLWLEPSSFKAQMRRQGVVVDEGANLTLRLLNGAFVSLPTESYETMSGKNSMRTRCGVIAFSDVFGERLNQPGSVWFEGWDNPTVHVGSVAFQVGTTKQLITGEKFYDDIVGTSFFERLSGKLAHPKKTTWYVRDSFTDIPAASSTEIETGQPGVYGVVTQVRREQARASWLRPAKPGDVLLTFQAVRSNETGKIRVRLPRNVSFTTSFEPASKTNVAVMVRFAGEPSTDNSGYSTISPEDLTFSSDP